MFPPDSEAPPRKPNYCAHESTGFRESRAGHGDIGNSGLCDEAISYPVGTRNASELLSLRQTIRQIQPKMLINLAAGRGWSKSLRDYLFFRSCGIRKIIGTPWRRRDLQVQPTPDGGFEPESKRLASRLLTLGPVNVADRHSWDLGLTQAERNQSLELLPGAEPAPVAVSVGTKLPVKDWGEENWKRLLGLLSMEMPGRLLVFLGSADELARSEKLSRAWTGPALNFCGKISPRVSAAILERCRIFIGHDSGPMHLASAAGVPTLGLFSWFNPPGQWFPGHQSWKSIKVLYPKLPAGGWKPQLQMKRGVSEGIGRLRPDEVFGAAMELWHGSSERPVAAARGRLANSVVA